MVRFLTLNGAGGPFFPMFTGLFAVVDVRQIDVRLYTVDTSIRVRTYRQIQPCRRPRPFGGRDAGEWDLQGGKTGILRLFLGNIPPAMVRVGVVPACVGLAASGICKEAKPESCGYG